MKKSVKLAAGCGVGCLCLMIWSAFAVAFGIQFGFVPDTVVLREDEIHERQLAKLAELGVIEPDERVLFFYSAALFSIAKDGQLLTPERVVSYWEDKGELLIESTPYEDVVEVELVTEGSLMEDAVIEISYVDERDRPSSFEIWASTEEGRHEELFAELLERTRPAAQPGEPSAAEAPLDVSGG